MPFQELPTGLIFAGINVPDHDLLFQQIAQTVSSPTPPSSSPGTLEENNFEMDVDSANATCSQNHVVILQSKDCSNLKSAQKSMIEQFLGLGIAGAINPLEVLSWFSKLFGLQVVVFFSINRYSGMLTRF